jgi:hypothetical protein
MGIAKSSKAYSLMPKASQRKREGLSSLFFLKSETKLNHAIAILFLPIAILFTFF